MAGRKPTTKLDVVGNLDLMPHKGIELYFNSKIQRKYLLRPPNADSAGDSIELLAIRNEREYNEMIKAQKELLDNAELQDIINYNRIKELYKEQDKLRASFVELNHFMKDCSDKKMIAQKCVSIEQNNHENFLKLIKEHRSQIDVMLKFKTALLNVVKELEPYETVINEVIHMKDTWTSVKDCTDRCDALMLAQVEIMAMKEDKLTKIEKCQNDMIKLSNEAALTVMGYINELTTLERGYDEARNECLKWEKILHSTKESVTRFDLSRQRMWDGIWGIYRLLCRRRGMGTELSKEQVEEQLDFIRNEMNLLQQVLADSIAYKK